MQISVITVAFNAADTLGDTIESVQAQTHTDREYIIVDGASKDNTRDLVARYRSAVTRFVSEPDRGMYDGLNKGLRLATGDVIGLLNADDCYAERDVLAKVATVFADPDVNACYGDLVYVDRHDPTRIVRFWRSCPMRSGLVERGWYPPHPTFFVRKTLYDSLGGFDLDFGTAADVELMIRFLGRAKVHTVYIPHVLVRMRMGGMSNRSIRNIVAQNVQLYRAFRKNQLRYSLWFPVRKIPSRLMQFVSRPKGAR